MVTMMEFFKKHRWFTALSFVWFFISIPLAVTVQDEFFDHYDTPSFFFSWWLLLAPIWGFVGIHWLDITNKIQAIYCSLRSHIRRLWGVYIIILLFLIALFLSISGFDYHMWYKNTKYAIQHSFDTQTIPSSGFVKDLPPDFFEDVPEQKNSSYWDDANVIDMPAHEIGNSIKTAIPVESLFLIDKAFICDFR